MQWCGCGGEGIYFENGFCTLFCIRDSGWGFGFWGCAPLTEYRGVYLSRLAVEKEMIGSAFVARRWSVGFVMG